MERKRKRYGGRPFVPFKAASRPNSAILHAIQLAQEKLKAMDRDTATVREDWIRGDLTYKLRPVQARMADDIRKMRGIKWIVNSARRLGKSYLACVLAIQEAIRGPNRIIRLGAPTQKMMRLIIRPIFREILKDCPEDLRPAWNSTDALYHFPNDSEIQVSGCNNGYAENLRGNKADLIILDEAGFIDDLNYVMSDVLMPQLLTTGGKMILTSTPPRTPAHDFTEIAQTAQIAGNYSEFNIHMAGYDEDRIRVFMEESGGAESATWRREYLCQFVVDPDFHIIPEWRDSYVHEEPHDRFFQFYHRYNVMDLGVRDFNVNLFAYYDFRQAKIVVEDEMVIHGPAMTTKAVVDGVREKESRLWGDLPVYQRRADNNNPLMLQDMAALHGLSFIPVDKDELEAMVNNLRLLVAAGRVVIHPRCQHTIGCMRYGIWKENRKEWEKSGAYGHFDGLAALVYLARVVDKMTNPIPPGLDISEATHFIPDPKFTQENKELRKLSGWKR